MQLLSASIQAQALSYEKAVPYYAARFFLPPDYTQPSYTDKSSRNPSDTCVDFINKVYKGTVYSPSNIRPATNAGGFIDRCYFDITDNSQPNSKPTTGEYLIDVRYYCRQIGFKPKTGSDLYLIDPKGQEGEFLCIPTQACPVGNPFIPGTGEKLHQETDLQMAGAHPLTLTRSFKATFPTIVPPLVLGDSWMLNYQRFLEITTDNAKAISVTAVRGDGSSTQFDKNTLWQPYLGGSHGRDALTPLVVNNIQTGWIYSDFDTDAKEYYTLKGALTKIVERNGWTTTLTYSNNNPDNGLLLSVANHFGRKFTFGHTNGVITSVTDPNGGVIQYSYAGALLNKVTWQDKTFRQYHYENPNKPSNALTGITDEAGVRYATYAYDTQGRLVSEKKAGEIDVTTATYGSYGSGTQINTTPAPGQASQNTFISYGLNGYAYRPISSSAPNAACGGYAQTTTYDGLGQKLTETTFDGKHISYTYDAKGRQTSRTERLGSSAGAITYKTTSAWHATFNLPTLTTEPNKITAYTYDAKGNATGYAESTTSDATGILTTTAFKISTISKGWSYNTQQLVTASTIKIDSGVMQTLVVTYNSLGDILTIKKSSGSITKTDKFTNYTANGRPYTGVDQNGLPVNFRYTLRGSLLSVSVGAGATAQSVTNSYNLIGQIIKTVFTDNPVKGTPKTHKLDYSYSESHDEIKRYLNGVEIWSNNPPVIPSSLRSSGSVSKGSNSSSSPVWPVDSMGGLLININEILDRPVPTNTCELACKIAAKASTYIFMGSITSVTGGLGGVTVFILSNRIDNYLYIKCREIKNCDCIK